MNIPATTSKRRIIEFLKLIMLFVIILSGILVSLMILSIEKFIASPPTTTKINEIEFEKSKNAIEKDIQEIMKQRKISKSVLLSVIENLE